MNTIILAIVILLELITYIIIIDVILSWLTLVWVKFRPKFVSDLIDPIYKNIKDILPTSIWPIDFTPIVVFIVIWFIKWIILLYFPEVRQELTSF